ncbi:serine/threonine-protein kinase [Actinomadura geliboluensis]|uniref:serine/threonine-protein kinase n=1 Tax=Actinomadura geliboluensis TaxID=882440 RepID=UPI003722B436
MTARKPLTARDPESIGGHRLIERLGEGGQGVVYLAENENGGRVALKALHDRGGSRDAFLREISAARKVAPFCTAEIWDAGEDDDLSYVVTEFIDGPSLRELVSENGTQSGPALYRLAVGTATALAAIHEAGIVHRDFKPGNVLLGPDGPRVIDFGVARFLDATVTASSTVIGTPSYMAPEQLAGEAVGPAADVFAWGATIAYAANGRPPYGQDTIPAVMNRILKGRPDLGGLTGALRDLVAQALHKDAAKRPHSRDILLRLLEHSNGPITASEALTQGRALASADDLTLTNERTARWSTVQLALPKRSARRPILRRAGLMIGALAAIALLMGAVAMAVTGDSRTRSAATAPRPAATAPLSTARAQQAAPPAASQPDPPTTPRAVADAVQAAVAGRKTAAFTAKGNRSQSDDSFSAQGRLHYQLGSATNYDLTVRNPYGDEVSGDGFEARVILVGNCGYLREAPDFCYSTRNRPGEENSDRHVWMATEVRWVSSPYNIIELLRNSSSLTRETDAGTVTYRASAAIGPLAASGPVASFYRDFTGVDTKIDYTLVTTSSHLPKRLDIDLWTSFTPTEVVHSLYSATYRDWGSTGTITRPY